MILLEVRSGSPKTPDEIISEVPHWPEKTYVSAYQKCIVDGPARVGFRGVEGNAAGYPSHIDDTLNRAVLVYNELTYDHLKEKFPNSSESLKRGGFAENFVVNDEALVPSEVCIGDKYRVGSTVFFVTGPRFPCPKVDAWHSATGMTQYVKEHGFAGYFLRVLEEGECQAGDTFELLARPHPSYTLQRVSEGLWGGKELEDNSEEFLQALVAMDELIDRGYRETARNRLARLNSDESTPPEQEESTCAIS